MIKKVTLSFLAVLFFLSPQAQIAIKGLVVSKDSIPLPFASVSLLHGAKELAQKYCDSIGQFEFNISDSVNEAKIIASFLNKKSDEYLIYPDEARNILLLVNITHVELQPVIVKSKIPLIQKKADRIIYSIEGNPVFENKNLLEIFKNIPRITVKGFDIGLTGQGAVSVLINNRIVYLNGKDLIDYLNIFKNDISSIEIIPNPPANYDAEGGGLINIVIKRANKKGFYGDIQSTLTKNSYWQNNNSFNLRLRDKNFSLSCRAGYGLGDYKETIRTSYLFTTDQKGWLSESDNKLHYSAFNAGIATEYQFSKSSSVNLSFSYSNIPSNNSLEQVIYYQTRQLNDSLGLTDGSSLLANKTITASLSLHSDLKARKGSLDISFDLLRRNSEMNRYSSTLNYETDAKTPTNTFIQSFSYGNTPGSIASSKIDLSLPSFFFTWDTDIGLKYTYFSNNSNISYDQLINGSSIFQNIETADKFSYTEHNAAAYIQVSKQVKKWYFKTGLRYEGTFTEGARKILGTNIKKTFNNVFPSLFSQYNFSAGNSLGFSYSRRISRPRIWDVNPYRWYTDIYSFYSGNPFLVPSIQNNFEVSLSLRNKFIVSVYYNNKNKPVNAFPYNDDISIELRKENSGVLKNYGVIADVNSTFLKIIQNSSGFAIRSYVYKTSFNYSAGKTPLIATFHSNNSVNISPTIFASISFSATLPGYDGTVSRQNGDYEINISFKKQLVKNKLEIELYAQDIFKSGSTTYLTTTPNFKSKYYNYYDFRYVSLTIKYKFGKQIKTAKEKTGFLNTERTRL